MKSMTGFGQGSATQGGLHATASLRSVNGRFLDLVLRLPEVARGAEPGLREKLNGALGRGRVELVVTLRSELAAGGPRLPDRATLASLRQTANELFQAGLLDDPTMRFGDLVTRGGDRLESSEGDPAAAEAAVMAATAAALGELVGFREREGSKLAGAIAARLDALAGLREELVGRRQEIRGDLLAGMRRRLLELLGELPQAPVVSEERWLAEAALLAERSDVAEELDRLGAHLDHARQLLAVPEAVGRRLDFLAQEIHRELTTLGNKCRDLAMGRAVLDAKLLCEELREQAQNVE
jgi:uncharacterized protein (TIGR00255 family)